MDATQLAKAMLEYQELATKLALLGDAIKETVMKVGKTQTVGSLTASYSGGRKTYNYEVACNNNKVNTDPYRTVKEVETIDYRSACKDLGLDVPFTQSEPSVTLKLA